MTEPSPSVAATAFQHAPSRWARVRASLIALVLLVEGVSALPDRAIGKRNLKRPEAVRFVESADRALGVLGLSPGRAWIEHALLDGSAALVRARDAALRPFEPLFHYTATHQRWGLFLLGTRECFGIHVDALRADGSWLPLYHALDAGPEPLEAMLRYRRLRGIYNPGSRSGPHGQYGGFVHALARRVLRAEPDYQALRVQMERLRIVEPGRAPERLGFEYAVTVTRADVGAATR